MVGGCSNTAFGIDHCDGVLAETRIEAPTSLHAHGETGSWVASLVASPPRAAFRDGVGLVAQSLKTVLLSNDDSHLKEGVRVGVECVVRAIGARSVRVRMVRE